MHTLTKQKTSAINMPNPSAAQYTRQESSYEESAQQAFGLLSCDPGQAYAFRQIINKARTQIEGVEGTGKTFLLTQLLTHALSKGKRCLVICGKTDTFGEIRQQLHTFGLDNLVGSLGSTGSEKSQLLQALRQRRHEADNPLPFNSDVYQQKLRQCHRDYKRLDQYFHAINRPSFGPHDWTDTIGLYMRSSQKESKALLNSQLNPQDFTFDYDWYTRLKKSIPVSHQLYQAINTIKHPLSKLNQRFFTEHSKIESLECSQKQLETFLDKTTILHHRFITKLDDYAEKLEEHYEQHYQELSQLINKIEEDLEDYISRFGPEFEESSLMSTSRLHVYGVFFNRQKEILRAKSGISEDFVKLQKIHASFAYFDYTFPIIDTRNNEKLYKQIADFRQATDEWRALLPAVIQEELQRLSSKTVHPSLDFHEQIEALEYDLDVLVEELNDSALYNEPLVNHMLTIPKRQQLLEELLERLKNTHFHLREYSPFYDWQHHWLTQPEYGRRLIAALIKVKPTSWLAAFESWFLHHCLVRYQKHILPHQTNAFDRYIKAWQQVQELMPPQIIDHWQKDLKAYVRKLKRNDKKQYRLFFGRHQEEEDINLAHHYQLIADCHPIVFADSTLSYDQLSKLLPRFDYLLIDDGQLLSPVLIDPLLKTDKQIVYFSTPLSIRQLELAARLEEGFFDRMKLTYKHRKDNRPLFQLSEAHGSNMEDATTEVQSIFLQELAKALEPYIDTNRLDFHASLNRQVLPLAIRPAQSGQTPIFIQIDGFFSTTPPPSFLWEQQLRDQLQQLGYQYCSTQTINWWKHPRQEARRLATQLLSPHSKSFDD